MLVFREVLHIFCHWFQFEFHQHKCQTRWYEPINKRSMRWSSTQKCPTKKKHGIQHHTGCKYGHASSVYSFMYSCVFLCFCLYVCFRFFLYIFIYTSVYLSIAVYAYLYSVVYSCLLHIYMSIHLCMYLSIYLSIHPSKHPSIYLSVYLAMYPSNCLSAFFFMSLPIKSSTYPFFHAWVYPQYSGETTRQNAFPSPFQLMGPSRFWQPLRKISLFYLHQWTKRPPFVFEVVYSLYIYTYTYICHVLLETKILVVICLPKFPN